MILYADELAVPLQSSFCFGERKKWKKIKVCRQTLTTLIDTKVVRCKVVRFFTFRKTIP